MSLNYIDVYESFAYFFRFYVPVENRKTVCCRRTLLWLSHALPVCLHVNMPYMTYVSRNKLMSCLANNKNRAAARERSLRKSMVSRKRGMAAKIYKNSKFDYET